MPKRIKEDQQQYRDVISGKARKELSKFIGSKAFPTARPDGKGVLYIPVPTLDLPQFEYGDDGKNEGVSKGPGKKGEVIGKDPAGEGDGAAGDQQGEYKYVGFTLDYILDVLAQELDLPPMLPKHSDLYDSVKKQWTSLSKTGPNSLRHTRKTLLNAIKRQVATGEMEELFEIPGVAEKMQLINIQKDDVRYRQFIERKIPSSNAVIFLGRDCSGSMTLEMSQMSINISHWIDTWVSKHYSNVIRKYYIHDTEATEVDRQKFLTAHQGGGTKISSYFEAVANAMDTIYSSDKYNIIVLHFSDGDNWQDDNSKVLSLLNDKFTKKDVNLIGCVQINDPHGYSSVSGTFNTYLKGIKSDKINIRSAEINVNDGDIKPVLKSILGK